MTAFMKLVKRAKTTSRPLFPAWEFAVVLGALCKPPFEPLESAHLKIEPQDCSFVCTYHG